MSTSLTQGLRPGLYHAAAARLSANYAFDAARERCFRSAPLLASRVR